MPLYTVGHSNHSADRLFEIIAPYSVTVIIDVRSVPYSGRFPHFNRDRLAEAAELHDISYEWWGESLGGIKSSGATLDSIRESYSFRNAIRKLIERFGNRNEEETACLLCAEADPRRCHRSMLIGPSFRSADGGIDLHHILPDGTLILQSELEEKQEAPKVDRAGTMSLFD